MGGETCQAGGVTEDMGVALVSWDWVGRRRGAGECLRQRSAFIIQGPTFGRHSLNPSCVPDTVLAIVGTNMSSINSTEQYSGPVVRGVDSGIGFHGFKSQPCILLACGVILSKSNNRECWFPHL